MANAVKGEAPLKLKDGRTLTLVLDMEALVTAESIYGKPMGRLMQDASEGFMGASAAMLQGALARHHPNLERSDIFALLVSDYEALTEAMGEAAESAFPDQTESAGNGGRRQAGTTSGGNGAKKG